MRVTKIVVCVTACSIVFAFLSRVNAGDPPNRDDPPNGQRFGLLHFRHGNSVDSIAISPSCDLLATATTDGDLLFWDRSSGAVVDSYKWPRVCYCVAFLTTNELLIKDDTGLSLFRRDAKIASQFYATANGIGAVVVSPSKKLVAVTEGKTVTILDSGTGKPVRELERLGEKPVSIAH